ncbi:hypothetical protein FRC10_009881, partial [Ceratobasidium sp. 414]
MAEGLGEADEPHADDGNWGDEEDEDINYLVANWREVQREEAEESLERIEITYLLRNLTDSDNNEEVQAAGRSE